MLMTGGNCNEQTGDVLKREGAGVGVGRGLGITYLGVLEACLDVFVLSPLRWKGREERRRKKKKRKRGKRGL